MRTGRTLLATAVVLALGSAIPAQDLPVALQASFEEGVRALKAGKLDEAETAFRAVLAKGGATAYVHNNLGIVLQERGQHEKAIAQFREAVRLAPREPLARLQLARVEKSAGDWVGAVEQYRAPREMKPKEPEYVYGLGNAYLHLSEWCLRELDTLEAGSARLYQAQGHNYRVQGRPDLALKAFERAAKADPALPEIHLAMAQIHLEQKRWAEARQEIERELQIVPDSAGARALGERLRALEASSP
jgi:tetratricopeptide (TPR) repeat protein